MCTTSLKKYNHHRFLPHFNWRYGHLSQIGSHMNQPQDLLWHDDPYQLTVVGEDGDETIVRPFFIFFHIFHEDKILQQQRKDLY